MRSTMRKPVTGLAVACCMLGFALPPAAQAVEASFAHDDSVHGAPFQAGISAYRRYAQTQANGLVAMTKVLLREIRSGDVDAAQSVYAPAHRYLGRLAPIATSFKDLYGRMDAVADESAPDASDLSGFHRIEQGLFAKKSAAGLSPYAERLLADALELQTRVAALEITPDNLVTAPGAYIEAAATWTLDGGTERYSRSDLWTIEANVDGTQNLFAAIEPQVQARDPGLAKRIAARFTDMNERVARYKDGCGFKTFDALGGKDRALLADGMTALSTELSKLRGTFAIDLSLAELREATRLR